MSLEAHAERDAARERFLARLDAIDPAALDAQDRLSHQMLHQHPPSLSRHYSKHP